VTPDEMAGAILNDQARKAAEAVDLPCHILGSDVRRMREELFAEFWFRISDIRSASLDSEFAFKTVGLLQFTVYAPLDTDVSEIMPFVNHLKRSLALIFGHPERSFYAAEIVRHVHSGAGAVDRELSRLEHSGLVCVERVGNQKHYRANRKSPIYHELFNLVQKTIGLREPLRQSLEPFTKKIKAAFVYGSIAKNTDTAKSDVDLMIVGEGISYSDIYKELGVAESTLSRSVNPNFLATGEWQRKLKRKDSFVSRINSQPKMFVIGTEDDLRV